MIEPETLKIVQVRIPETIVEFDIVMPTDFDNLLDLAEGDPEQNLPYWAELWPSGIALAAYIFAHQDEIHGMHALELGCGLGVTAVAAMRSGARLMATDYSPEALALCATNCVANGVSAPVLLQMNWRRPDAEFFTKVGDGIRLLLAADVLYEERDIAPLLGLVEETLPAEGELWLAEPGRRPARLFLEQMSARGWRAADTSYSGPWPDPEDNRRDVVVTVHRISRPIRTPEESTPQ